MHQMKTFRPLLTPALSGEFANFWASVIDHAMKLDRVILTKFSNFGLGGFFLPMREAKDCLLNKMLAYTFLCKTIYSEA